MEDNAIISLLEELKTSSRSRITNNLIKIRQQVIVTEDGIKKFKNNGGLPLLVSLLHKPNEKITDLALSILGNCCMHRECVLEVEKLNGIRYVVYVIKNIAKDSILCRACRVIGNIAQIESVVDHVHEYGTIGAICSLLDASHNQSSLNSCSISSSTKLMAVRALRLLWTTSTRQQEMLAQNAVKSVILVLIHHKDNWLKKKQDKELLIGVLRCLLHFTENPSHDLVLQIVGDGTGFQSIVSLIPLQPYFTVKCITNLSTVATTRSQLETSEAARILIERLSVCQENDPTSSWLQDDLSALCLLCRHASTREEVRTRNGLPVLLAVVKYSSNKQQQGQVLHALLHFIYDKASLQILISEGLVPTLVTCFSQFLSTMKCQHNQTSKFNNHELPKHNYRKFLRSKSPCYNTNENKSVNNKRSHEESNEEFKFDFKKRQRQEDSASPIPFDTRLSPQPSTCHSPNCTPPRSIAEDDPDSDDDDSIRYSPVCSDSESEDEKSNWEMNIVNFENEDFVHYEMGDNELENALDEEMEPKIGEVRTLGWLLVLLSRVSYMEDPDPALASVETIQTLLRYMQLSSQPVTRAARILFRIVSRWDFLMILLNNNIVFILHNLIKKLPHGDLCRQCNDLKKFLQILSVKLTCIAESGYGKGQIAHTLLRGEDDKQEKLIVALPYLIQSRSLLRSLFHNCHGLDTLLNVISKRENDYWTYAVNALSLLACKLKIKDPKQSESFKTIRNINCDYLVDLTNREIVTLKLDDDSIVKADKNRLIEQSEFFKALLTGQFKESNEKIVHLGNVSNNGLKYLLNLLEHSKISDIEDGFPLCLTLSVVLEVVVLTDRFLLEKFTDTLSRAILKYRMLSETVAQIYKWSVESRTDILRVESIAFSLVGSMSEEERTNIFREVIDDGYSKPLIEDCRLLLTRYLNII